MDARRLPEADESFAAVTEAPGRLRTVGELAGAVRPTTPWVSGGPGDPAEGGSADA